MAKPHTESAAAYIGLAHHRIDPEILRSRMQERDARAASDTRTPAQRWLGDPPAFPSQPMPLILTGFDWKEPGCVLRVLL